MHYTTEETIDTLINHISSMKEVQSIGISGSKSPLPKAGEGDIDIFIYCNEVPSIKKRQELIQPLRDRLNGVELNVFEGGHWGVGDFAYVNGVETWLMYFTIDDTLNHIEAIRNGELPHKLDNYYYPIGRCAMLSSIHILYDRENFLGLLKDKLSCYPEDLAKKLLHYHLEKLEDVEDLERAVARKDVLFYHFALDLAMDHYLQALFALNKIYFPSRKRSLQYIAKFAIKPENCGEHLLEGIQLGSCAESIAQSYELWKNMCSELKRLSEL